MITVTPHHHRRHCQDLKEFLCQRHFMTFAPPKANDDGNNFHSAFIIGFILIPYMKKTDKLIGIHTIHTHNRKLFIINMRLYRKNIISNH